jgi:signal transduction histidine kinase/ActR/RegA family two-component response regulator
VPSGLADVVAYLALIGALVWFATRTRAARRRADLIAAEVAARTHALAASEERYRSFIQRSAEGIWRIEVEQPIATDLPEDEQIAAFYRFAHLAECNDAMARMYGLQEAGELTGARLDALLVPSDPANRAYLSAFIRSGYCLTDAESHERDRHGHLKYFLNNLVGTVEHGKLVRAWGTQRDITARRLAEHALRASEERLRRALDDGKRVEEELRRSVARLEDAERDVQQLFVLEREARADAERSNRAKDEFLATLSHELRSPLSAALSWTHMLRRGQLDAEKTARALETIERSTRLQVRLIEDLLDISRIVSGKLTLETGVVELGAVIDAAVETARAGAEARHLGLLVQRAVEPLAVVGDAARLEQIVGNLVANAIKFTSSRGTITVAWRREGDEAEISVRDTGVGIPTETLPHVFDRFRQADSSTTRRHGGLGLGLAIVRHLVELHGGTIVAESGGEGQGTVMRIRLPLAAAADLDAQPARSAGSTGVKLARQLTGVRVLIVDDEADVREFLATALALAGAEVTSAASVEEALARRAAAAPTVIVTDLAMPGRDGFSLLQALRADAVSLPVVALTALAGATDRQRVLAAGFAAHLTKPIDPPTLIAAVARVLEVERRTEGPPRVQTQRR